jgi:hypothetical protein
VGRIGIPAVALTLNIFTAGGTVLLVSALVTAAISRLHPRLPGMPSTPVLGWLVVAP